MEFLDFRIKNYKGIRDASFSLGAAGFSNICTLIGLNESGKTTLLEAIYTFYNSFIPEEYLDDTPKETQVIDPYHFIPRSEFSNFNGSCSISANVSYTIEDLQDLISEATKMGYVVRMPPNKTMTITVTFPYENSKFVSKGRSIGAQGLEVKKTKGKVWQSVYKVRPLWLSLEQCLIKRLPEIIYYPDFAFDFPERIYIEEYDLEPKESRFYRNFLQDAFDSFDEGYKIEDHILDRLKDTSGKSTAALRQTMRKLENGIRDLVFKSDFSVFKSNDINVDIGLPTFDAEYGAYFIELKIDQDGEFFSIQERSRGFRWFFSFILLTQFRAHRILGKYPVFLIDEPASNLHPSAQNKLLRAFEEIGEFYKGSIVYSTHSHYLINPLWLENSYIVINEAINYNDILTPKKFGGGIKIYKYRNFVNEFPSKTDYFQPVLDVIQYTPSKLDNISNPLIVEGKSDFYILKKVSEQLGYDFTIIPALGSGSADSIISLYMGWGKKYLLLLDDDKEGRRQLLRYISIGVPESNVATFKTVDITFSGYEIESFIDDSFKLAIGLNPQAKKKDIADSVYSICSSGGSLPITADMRSKFTTLFDHIKAHLDEIPF